MRKIKEIFKMLSEAARTALFIKGAVTLSSAIIAKFVIGFPDPALLAAEVFVRLLAAAVLLVLAMLLNDARENPVSVEAWILAGLAASAAGALADPAPYWMAKLFLLGLATLVYLSVNDKKD